MPRYFVLLLLPILIFAGNASAWQDKNYEQAADKFGAVVAAVKEDNTKLVEYLVNGMAWRSKVTLSGYQPFESFIDRGTPEDDSAYLAHLDDWLKKDQESVIALQLRATYEYKHAWFVRGNHYAVQVPYAKMKEFIDSIQMAKSDIAYSMRLGGVNPYARLLQLRIAKNSGDYDEARQFFEEAIGQYPDFYPLYAERLTQLTPLWGGSVKAMIAFTEHYTNHLPEGSALHVLPILLYKELVRDMEFNCMIYPLDKENNCFLRYDAFLTSSKMEGWLKAAFALYPHTDRYEFDRLVVLTLINGKSLFQPPYDRIIHIAADTLSDDYAFNLNYGNYYFGNGKYRLATDYYAKALNEMATFPFPSDEEKAEWMSEVQAQEAKAQALSSGGASLFRNQ